MRHLWVCVLLIALLAPAMVSSVGAAPTGQTLVVAVGGTTPTLNPHAAGSTPAVGVFLQMFEGLTRFNDKGQLEPALATAWRRINETTWDFELRPGVQFHSGHPFTAEDVKFSIEQVLRPELKSVQRTRIALVSRVEAVNDRTVRVVTDKPFPILPAQLAIVFIASKRPRPAHHPADPRGRHAGLRVAGGRSADREQPAR